jgi:hypothetical protein
MGYELLGHVQYKVKFAHQLLASTDRSILSLHSAQSSVTSHTRPDE